MQSHTELLRPVNGFQERKTTIGTVTVTEPFERKLTHASACNYTIVTVPEGTYPVYLLGDGQGGPTWAMIGYRGIVTDDHYVNYLGASSSLRPPQGIGEERGASAQTYPYVVAEAFATDPNFELAEDWGITSEQREYSDGRPYTAYSLIRPDGTRCSL